MEFKQEMKILDPACGSKMFWFNKSEPHTTYTDIRKETFSLQDRGKLRKVVINPDKIADFTNLPFRDYEFNLIVFDPPHLKRAGENSWLAKKYGKLPKDVWPQMLSKGFKELWRVLALDGILLFKWSDNQIPFKDVLNLFDQQPILGDQSTLDLNQLGRILRDGATAIFVSDQTEFPLDDEKDKKKDDDKPKEAKGQLSLLEGGK